MHRVNKNMKKRNVSFVAGSFLAFFLFLGSLTAAYGQESHSVKAARLLNESGFSVTKVEDNLWTVPFEGKTQKNLTVITTVANDLLLTFCVVAEKKDLRLAPELMQKLLRSNWDFDRVKIGVDKDGDLSTRIDMSIRILDKDELKQNLDQVAAACDEIYGLVKPHLVKAK